MSTQRPNLWRVFSEATHVISAHFYHFLALSILFLYPISFANTIYPFLVKPNSVHSHYTRFLSSIVSTPDSEVPSAGKSQLLIQLLYILFVYVFSFCAIPSITQSTFLGFYGKPVSFLSSLKSILVSFFPLLATMLVRQVILGLIIFAFAIFGVLTYNGLLSLGFEMDYDSDYFLVFVILFTALLVVVLIYMQVEWCLTTAVVVLESKWGFAPLKRSSYLVKGVRGVVLSTMLFLGLLYGILFVWYLSFVANSGRNNEGLSGSVVVQMVIYAGFSTILSLFGLAANSILFAYCKELHGELEFKIDERFGVEYVPLPFDVVNVV